MISTRIPSLSRGRWISRIGLVLVAGVLGCGESRPSIGHVYEVKGKVVLPDGKPLSRGRIYFVRTDGALSSNGTIGTDGTFSLTTGSDGEGAPPGEYKVRIEPDDPNTLPTKRNPNGKLPFSAKYLDEDTSNLTVTVEPKPNQLEPFRLTAK
jgi:hypothetical protein